MEINSLEYKEIDFNNCFINGGTFNNKFTLVKFKS